MTNESVSNVTDHASPAVILQQVPCDHPDFLTLCQELDRFLNRAIGGEDKREKYKKFNVLATMDHEYLPMTVRLLWAAPHSADILNRKSKSSAYS